MSCTVTSQLISLFFFFFATQILNFFFLNLKFQASSLFCDCTSQFVLEVIGKPEDWFVCVAAHISTQSKKKKKKITAFTCIFSNLAQWIINFHHGT